MAQVSMQAGPFRIVSLMSREAADALDLEVGSLAVAVKSTTVGWRRPPPAAREMTMQAMTTGRLRPGWAAAVTLVAVLAGCGSRRRQIVRPRAD